MEDQINDENEKMENVMNDNSTGCDHDSSRFDGQLPSESSESATSSMQSGHKENNQLPAHTIRDVYLQKFNDKAMELKSDILKTFEEHLESHVNEFVKQVEQIDQPVVTNNFSANRHARNNEALSGKVFIARRSILSELLEIDHIRTIYHIFVAILIVFMLNQFVHDLMDQGRVVLDFQLIEWTFGKFSAVLTIWIYMTISALTMVFPIFLFWATNRIPGRYYWFDYTWLTVYVIYQLLFFLLPLYLIHAHQLPIASTVIVAAEQIRYMMKAHAFVRENIPRVRAHKIENNKEIQLPNFSKYLYFLFAPTLVYRDEYPRNPPPVRWHYVMSNFAQVLACLFYIYYIFERFCIPVFQNFNKEFITPRSVIVSVFGSMLPGTLVLFIAFFAILHSWLNAFAEMLRFSDRLFYKDWWNSSSFANYYRTWNLVVHDWLYTYIYKDICSLVGSSNRGFAMAVVFFLSAVFHEYILSVAFGFIYPVLFFLFAGVGFAFIFVPSKSQRSGNVFMWVALFHGNGLLMCLYSMEWYARGLCPVSSDSFVDYIIPRSWTCDFSGFNTTQQSLSKIEL